MRADPREEEGSEKIATDESLSGPNPTGNCDSRFLEAGERNHLNSQARAPWPDRPFQRNNGQLEHRALALQEISECVRMRQLAKTREFANVRGLDAWRGDRARCERESAG